MSQSLRCPAGHEWTPLAGASSSDSGQGPTCPVCGALADTLMLPAHAAVAVAGGVQGAASAPLGGRDRAIGAAGEPLPDSRPGPTEEMGADVTRPTNAAAKTPRTHADEPLPAVPGYEILEVLGRGGMGVVYKARQVSLSRIVAIKMLSGGSRARFRVEAEAIARLQHPNIVQIHEVGEAQGQPYFSQEHIAGGSLADRLDGAPWSAKAAARLVRTLAEAMHFTHSRGIVHRDLKPANVLMADGGTPKISDFGLAKQLESNSGQTATGDIMGSPSYMSPEQASGVTREITAAADVYSLGAILYELVTGRPPFRAETAVDTVLLVLSDEPVAPRRLQPKLPRDLETICLKCLEKSPRNRYASAQELADDLGRFLAGEPIRARPVPLWVRAAKWARRRPAAAAAIGIALLAATILLVGGTIYNVRLNAALARVQREQERRAATLAQAQEVVERLLGDFNQRQLAGLPHAEPVRRELLTAALQFCEEMQRQNPEEPEVRWQLGRAQRQAADLQALLGEPAEAEKSYDRAIGVLQALAAAYPSAKYRRELAGAWENKATLLAQAGRAAEAEAAYRRAADDFEQLAAADPADAAARAQVARVWDNLGVTLLEAGRTEDAQAALDKALAMRRALVAEAPADVERERALATSLNNVGTLWQATGRAAEAVASFREARELFRALNEGTTDNPANRQGLNSATANVAAALAASGNLAAAKTTFAEAIDGWQSLTNDFPAIAEYRSAQAQALSNLGALLEQLDDRDAALAQHARARELCQRLVDDNAAVPAYRELLATSLHRLGDLATRREQFAEADELLSQAIRLRTELADERPHRADGQHQWALVSSSAGRLLMAQHDATKAKFYFHEATEHEGRALKLDPDRGEYQVSLARERASLAEALLELGEIDEAAAVANEIAAGAASDGAEARDAARLLVQCIPLVERYKAAVRPTLAEECGARAVELLRAAVERGDDQARELVTSPACEPLRGRADFQALVAELGKDRSANSGTKP
ncbi:MAG: serine/threonine protein kinase [Planctomycetia bacterium]|nr:serine/threonine protein kinase [Planctomycetia bacterium]